MLSPFSPYSTKCFYNFSTSNNQSQKTQHISTFSPTKNLFNLITNSQSPKTPTASISSPSKSLFNLIAKPQNSKSLNDQQNLQKSNNSPHLNNEDFKDLNVENEYGEKAYYTKEKVYVARVVKGHRIGFYEQTIKKEIEYIQELGKGCDNIIRYYGYVTKDYYIYMITNWAEFRLNDLLYSKKDKLDWNQKVSIARGIANALRHCHQQGKLHYDLRSENVLLTDNLEPMLYNFRIPGGSSSTDCLTRWSSPEAWKHKIHKPSSEVYSFSTILWELSAEKLPFDSIPDESICQTAYKRPKPESIVGTPIVYRDLMIKGWAQNPNDRPTMNEVFKILEILEFDFKNGQEIKRVSETSDNYDMTFDKEISKTSSLINDFDMTLELESNLSSNDDDSTIFIPDFTTNALNRDDYSESIDKAPSHSSSLHSVSTLSLFQDYIYSVDTLPKLLSNQDSTISAEPVIKQPLALSNTLEDAISFYNNRKYKKAFTIFKAHSEYNNDPIANYWIGLYYYKGLDGGNPNFKNSVKYLSKAAEQGQSDAQFLYAKLLFAGHSIERHKNNSIKIGVEMLKKSVDAGNLEAMNYYGKLLIKGGYTVKKDVNAGRELINRANEIKISTCSDNRNKLSSVSMKKNNASTLENSGIISEMKTRSLSAPSKPINLASRRSANLSLTIDTEKLRLITYY
ncbi:kinase-like domain-containing protein [Gigaspora rosea]|uniref:Kinase-like domain-containing protein n=1 Tax=Gigaspora rosea TaxID=44941 RepID=A0A397U2R8_9GLOM|nr:kinase-like domain-containing protein [Gigaspora rosea]